MPRTPENILLPLTGQLEDEMVDPSGSTGNWVRITETSRRIKSCSRPRYLPGLDSGSLHRREGPFLNRARTDPRAPGLKARRNDRYKVAGQDLGSEEFY